MATVHENSLRTKIPKVELTLDVQSLSESERFWSERLGFQRIDQFDRGNLPCDWVRMASDDFPGFVLRLSNCAPRPVMGCTPSSMRRLTLYTRSLHSSIARLGHDVVWEIAPGTEGHANGRVSFLDRNGYLIELAALPDDRPGDSAYAGASL